jgi:hypothetical protein
LILGGEYLVGEVVEYVMGLGGFPSFDLKPLTLSEPYSNAVSGDDVWPISDAEILETSAPSWRGKFSYIVGEDDGAMTGAGDGYVAEARVEQIRVDWYRHERAS